MGEEQKMMKRILAYDESGYDSGENVIVPTIEITCFFVRWNKA